MNTPSIGTFIDCARKALNDTHGQTAEELTEKGQLSESEKDHLDSLSKAAYNTSVVINRGLVGLGNVLASIGNESQAGGSGVIDGDILDHVTLSDIGYLISFMGDASADLVELEAQVSSIKECRRS